LANGISRPLTNWANSVEGCPDWSRDGNTLIFSSSHGGEFDIWTTDIAGSSFTQLTQNSGSNTQPKYSPDGTQIVFLSNRTGKRELWLMGSDGSNQHVIGLIPLSLNDPSWSPVGDEIGYVGCTLTACNVYAITPDASASRQITSGQVNDWHIDWGPMGIVFDSDRSGHEQIWTVAAAGTGLSFITNPLGTGDFFPHWNRVTGDVVFTRSGQVNDLQDSSIWSRDNAGNESQLTKISGFLRNGDVNGDGTTDCNDLAIVTSAFGTKRGQSNYDSRADINGDGVVNIYDLSIVSRNVPAGTKCN
jgi:Tol biopolymer transport system component